MASNLERQNRELEPLREALAYLLFRPLDLERVTHVVRYLKAMEHVKCEFPYTWSAVGFLLEVGSELQESRGKYQSAGDVVAAFRNHEHCELIFDASALLASYGEDAANLKLPEAPTSALDTRTYREKLLDPRWQRKRLGVLARDEWTCQKCGRKDKTLHVHHIAYGEGEPWDTPDSLLNTLCADCHESEPAEQKIAVRGLLDIFGQLGLRTSRDIELVCLGFEYWKPRSPDFPAAFRDALVQFLLRREKELADGTWYSSVTGE